MGSGYLVDSNSVIDILMLRIPEGGVKLLSGVKPTISIITRIELFCKAGISKEELDKLNKFLPQATVYHISEPIALVAINIRINYKIKLPDAIIAATALSYDLTLVTHNTKDFKNIKGLKLIDPYNI